MSFYSIKSSLLALTVIAGALALKYPDRALFDEHRENVPHPDGLPILGSLLALSKNKERYFEFLLEIYEQLDTLTFRLSSLTIQRNISTIDPRNIEYILKTNFSNYNKSDTFKNTFHDFLGNGIFNTDGENWKLQRRTASQIFHVKNFQTEFSSIFVRHIQVMSDHIFDKAADQSQPIDFHEVMLKFTMDTFVEIAFGVKINSLLKQVEFAESFDAIQLYNFLSMVFPLHTVTNKIKETLNFRSDKKTIAQHMSIINTFVYNIIEERRSQPENTESAYFKTDLLLRFMKAKNSKGDPYTDEELRNSMLNFIVAGRDTSAQTLSWLFYNVMLYPRIENKLLDEIIEFMPDGIENDTVKLYEAIQKMTYSHAMLYEVLRLYPAVPGNRKQALKDDVLPDGTVVYKGDEVTFQPFCQGRHEKVWGPDAKEFKPERWISEKGDLLKVDGGKFVAFHAGPRVCLGQNMATLEIVIAMALLIKNYKFKSFPGHKVEFLNQITLSMKNGMRVYVEKR
ncbi:cytochrome P450 [Helicostylum pulchrum]|nr:cytochrome P450 [Helicostylum pulchrum]